MPPQVDLSACTGGGQDRKIACETLAQENNLNNNNNVDSDDDREQPPDFPPESFWLSKDAEFDWFDRNAFLERKESAKGIKSNSSSTRNPNLNPGPNSSSQRFLKSSKTSLFGLPKTQKMNYVWKTCSKPGYTGRFKRTEPVPIERVVAEPGSPKVSCMGRVRSKRGCRRSSSSRDKPPEDRQRTGGDKRKTGFYSRFVSMFRSNRSKKPVKETGSNRRDEPGPDTRSVNAVKMRDVPVRMDVEPVVEPPGLGAMRRLSSARKSDAWAAEEIRAAISKTFDTDRRRSYHS